MANTYRYCNLYKETINMLQLAWTADSLSKNTQNQLYDLRDIGEIYYSLGKIKIAQVHFNKGLHTAKQVKNTFMEDLFHHMLAMTYNKTGNTPKALWHIQKCIDHQDLLPDKSSLLTVALDVYSKIGEKEYTNKYTKILLDSGNVFAKRYALKKYINSRLTTAKDSNMISLFKSYNILTDSVLSERKAETVKKYEQIYN